MSYLWAVDSLDADRYGTPEEAAVAAFAEAGFERRLITSSISPRGREAFVHFEYTHDGERGIEKPALPADF
jgi:hypothetical protein